MQKKPQKKMKFNEALKQIDEKTRKKWEQEQVNIYSKVVYTNEIPEKIRYVCGMDLTFSTLYPQIAITSIVVIDTKMNVVAKHSKLFKVDVPYVPSFLAFREIDPMLETYKELKEKMLMEDNTFDIDVIFVDGNGILHPRKCGLAVHLGVILDKPTIGCAKTMFAIDGLNNKDFLKKVKKKFQEKGDELCHEIIQGKSGKIWGAAVKNSQKAFVPLIVSVGNKVTIESALDMVYEYSKTRVVEPVRLADKESRFLMNKFQQFVIDKKLTEDEALKIFKIQQII